jgi:D-glycero-D-manno-heptose 1,7-bisphosphate phosphatase
MANSAVLRRAVFFDRDGTLNHMVYDDDHGLVDSPQRVAQFRLFRGAAEAVRRINALGMLALVVSNQPGVAKGKGSLADVEGITARLHGDLALGGARLDGVYYCLHHPEAVVEEYRLHCDCRKPHPGLLLRAAAEHGVDLAASFMIGDGLNDVGAGAAAGCTTILLGARRCDVCQMMDEVGAHPDYIVANLSEAVALIERLFNGEPSLA